MTTSPFSLDKISLDGGFDECKIWLCIHQALCTGRESPKFFLACPIFLSIPFCCMPCVVVLIIRSDEEVVWGIFFFSLFSLLGLRVCLYTARILWSLQHKPWYYAVVCMWRPSCGISLLCDAPSQSYSRTSPISSTLLFFSGTHWPPGSSCGTGASRSRFYQRNYFVLPGSLEDNFKSDMCPPCWDFLSSFISCSFSCFHAAKF